MKETVQAVSEMKNLLRSTKKINKLLLLFLIAFSFACNEEASIEEVATKASVGDENIQLLMEMGFEKENIIKADEGYFVEGDMLFTEEVLQTYVDEGSIEQRQRSICSSSGFPYDIANVSDVQVYIDASTVPLEWIQATKEAINKFNAVPGTSINMRWRKYFGGTVNGPNEVLVEGIYSSAGYSAYVTWPSCGTGSISHFLRINLNGSGGSFDQRVATMMHELGHVIGYHHTNTSQGHYISGTCASDPASILRTNLWGGAPIFSTCDVDAFCLNYP